MVDAIDLAQKLARHAEIRRASKPRRLFTIGRRLVAIRASRLFHREIPATATTFWGDRMHVILPEPLSCELYGYGFFEPGLTSFMLAHVQPAQRVYDVGAHFGYFTRLASRLVGTTGTVHSFEPTPSTFGMLQRNTADLPNVRCNHVAAWHTCETVCLTDFGRTLSMFNSLLPPRLPNTDTQAARVVEVPALTLDSYADRVGPPDFVKIDAESAEWSILQGMGATLARHRPVITVELGDLGVAGAVSSRSLLEHVIDYGYAPFEYRGGRIQPHVLQRSYGYTNVLLTKVS